MQSKKMANHSTNYSNIQAAAAEMREGTILLIIASSFPQWSYQPTAIDVLYPTHSVAWRNRNAAFQIPNYFFFLIIHFSICDISLWNTHCLIIFPRS